MRVICTRGAIPSDDGDTASFALLASPRARGVGRAGTRLPELTLRAGLLPGQRAWDFLAIATSVIAADFACHRTSSPDGWTRQIELTVSVLEPNFWSGQVKQLQRALQFLSGDIWMLQVVGGGVAPPRPRRRRAATTTIRGDSICLLSGGADSLVGAIDTVSDGATPLLVSQVAQGDSSKQAMFARTLGQNLGHVQLSPAIETVGTSERSQRTRSLMFIALGALAASSLPQVRRGEVVDLLMPENGFISLNVPLTPMRTGSLSTRTTHPYFLSLLQRVLDAAGLGVRIKNPYQLVTKGEMFVGCKNQALLRRLAPTSTSCGRYARFNYHHCGRCVPCLVRRSAFQRWGINDTTETYVFDDLSVKGESNKDFDDVRSVAVAVTHATQKGVSNWAGSSLSHALLGDVQPYEAMLGRGLAELGAFLGRFGAL